MLNQGGITFSTTDGPMVHVPLEGQIYLELPPPVAVLQITPELRVYSREYPGAWWRFMIWFLLGWRWKRL